jgi:hypothetical protein
MSESGLNPAVPACQQTRVTDPAGIGFRQRCFQEAGSAHATAEVTPERGAAAGKVLRGEVHPIGPRTGSRVELAAPRRQSGFTRDRGWLVERGKFTRSRGERGGLFVFPGGGFVAAEVHAPIATALPGIGFEETESRTGWDRAHLANGLCRVAKRMSHLRHGIGSGGRGARGARRGQRGRPHWMCVGRT